MESSIIYKSDIRGDELKKKGDRFESDGISLLLTEDEEIHIKDSFLARTLVHNFSHDPNSPETFPIQKTVSLPYANIHGSPVTGSFLGAGSTIDLTSVQDSVVGEFSYIQVGEMGHRIIAPGLIWISSPRSFNFRYKHPPEVLKQYFDQQPGKLPEGIIARTIRKFEKEFEQAFVSLSSVDDNLLQSWSALNPYALVKGSCTIERNVFVSQRSVVEDAFLGPGSNVQENCLILNSRLEGNDVTAHGGKVINARLGNKVFVGFNSFLNGNPENKLSIGPDCIILPHTIIDLKEALEIPESTIVWGYIRNADDLKNNSLTIKGFSSINGELKMGNMVFHGHGEDFVQAFVHRIEHILEANGAYFNGNSEKGHAQRSQKIAFNIIQPYQEGPDAGMFPNIDIRP